MYADRVYESKTRRHSLRSQGIKDRIMHRSPKHLKELPRCQKVRNALISPIRSEAEKVFGTLNRTYQYGGCATRAWGARPWRCGSN